MDKSTESEMIISENIKKYQSGNAESLYPLWESVSEFCKKYGLTETEQKTAVYMAADSFNLESGQPFKSWLSFWLDQTQKRYQAMITAENALVSLMDICKVFHQLNQALPDNQSIRFLLCLSKRDQKKYGLYIYHHKRDAATLEE